MEGEISYIEIGSGEAQTTAHFLSDLFGWAFERMGDAGDGWFAAAGIRAGLHGNDPTSGMAVYFRVSDLDAAAARVRELGGEVVGSAVNEPGFGRFYNCRDPQGLRFGLHQPE